MNTQEIKLDADWLAPLRGEFERPYMSELKRFRCAGDNGSRIERWNGWR